MVAKTGKKKEETIQIIEVKKGVIDVCILGATPLICESMSFKTMKGLLGPPPKPTTLEKQARAKHDPLREYRDSVYIFDDPTSPTRIGVRSTAFKGAMCNTALDLPGAAKAQVGRLTYVQGDLINVYGVPKLFMAIVRTADMKHTPDVRTRAILPEWACRLTVEYVEPLLKRQDVINLLANGGIMQAIGGWRVGKGSGSFGQYRIVSPDDPDFLRIVQSGGRTAQLEALKSPEYYDVETTKLMEWFVVDSKRRGFEVAA
jgi:hypothetical protein